MSSEPPSSALIDLPPEPVSLGDVAPMTGLETSEFETLGGVEPLAGLEAEDFEASVEPLPDLRGL